MKQIKFNNLIQPTLLLDINLNGEIIDLHNDFDCTSIKINETTLLITLKKNPIENCHSSRVNYNNITISFPDYECNSLNALLKQKYPTTIANFSIGKMPLEDKQKSLFVLEFIDSDEYEIIATEALLCFFN